MKHNRCLYCYKVLQPGQDDFHLACSRKMFGTARPPLLSYTEDELAGLALQVISSQVTLTGVQPKLSLTISEGKKNTEPKRFTIVGLWGSYILKPSTPDYPHLPEVEDLTMHLATIANIAVVPHSLIRMQSGKLAYITKRIDRTKNEKLHMEDMCQLTGRLTEDKYKGSYEQVAKAIRQYSDNPGFDLVNFFEQLLFSFLTGNNDMHLKNFSLIKQPGIGYNLAPAYDMVAVSLINPADNEELALNLNGKKRKIKRKDFTDTFTKFELTQKQQENIFIRFEKAVPKWLEFIDNSFLTDDMKLAYKQLIVTKQDVLKS